ncbi:MAG: hypothetical protein ACJAW3_000411 [Lentimonas sp.]|jgi:hypothetical protein
MENKSSKKVTFSPDVDTQEAEKIQRRVEKKEAQKIPLPVVGRRRSRSFHEDQVDLKGGEYAKQVLGDIASLGEKQAKEMRLDSSFKEPVVRNY